MRVLWRSGETVVLHVQQFGMTTFLVAALYLAVYGVEWVATTSKKLALRYVSWKTWLLFILGQVCVLYFLTASQLSDFFTWAEWLPLLLLLAVILGIVSMFHVEHEKVCSSGGQIEQCLSPGFVVVKSAEIVFQQLVYMVIATQLITIAIPTLFQYILFTFLVALLHLPLIFRVNMLQLKVFALGSVMVAVPAYYIFTDLQLFWPAVYVHAMLQVFYWIVFSDMGLGKSRWRSG